MTGKVLTMPFSVEVLHEGRLVLFHLVDPMNLQELKTYLQEHGKTLFDESQHPVNVIYDCLLFHRLPADSLAQGMSMNRLNLFSYSGAVAVVTNQNFLSTLTELFAKLAHLGRIEFTHSMDEAFARMESVIRTQGGQGNAP
ncbi:MAG: hypothetical protein IT322_00590 [Anaerolineae bacterium]|nr:hypothetical protein [Anaerolineae bacterium]